MREVLADGRPKIDREAHWSHGGRERVLSVSLLPLAGADGRTLGVCSVVLDFSDSKARDHLDLLREAGVRLVSTLDVMSTAQELAELAVPVLADFVTVDLPDEMLPGAEPRRRDATTGVGDPSSGGPAWPRCTTARRSRSGSARRPCACRRGRRSWRSCARGGRTSSPCWTPRPGPGWIWTPAGRGSSAPPACTR